jgi:hypothetical protein
MNAEQANQSIVANRCEAKSAARGTIRLVCYGAFGSSIEFCDRSGAELDAELAVEAWAELGTVMPLCPSFVRKHPMSSGARSEIFIPSDTMNLQLRIGRAESSSESWQLTRQY